MTMHPYVELTAEELARLERHECAWCGRPMDPDDVQDSGRVTCSPRCRQARWRAAHG